MDYKIESIEDGFGWRVSVYNVPKERWTEVASTYTCASIHDVCNLVTNLEGGSKHG